MGVADASSIFLLVMNNTNEVPENTIVLDNCHKRVSHVFILSASDLTLMSNPLSLFDGLGSSREGHEVAFDNVLGIGMVAPKRHWLRKVVSGKGVSLGSGKTAGRVVH